MTALEEYIEDQPKIRIGDKIQQQWTVKSKIGEGSCGVIWLLENIKNEKAYAAMKVEPFLGCKDDEVLKMEVFVLKKMQNSPHFCRLLLAGRMENFNFLIMSLLGRSVIELRLSMPRKRFTTNTTLRIGMQSLEALKQMHMVGFIHRDVKPANFAFGSTKSTKRLAAFRGTVRYCSINVHRNMEQGRHDDIISLMYMLVELITGSLPWSGKRRKETASIKKTISDQHLFHHCPKNFAQIFAYLRHCEYRDIPNYALISGKLQSTLKNKKITDEFPFDWEKGGHYYEQFKLAPLRKLEKQLDEDIEKDYEASCSNNDVLIGSFNKTLQSLSNSEESSTDEIEKEDTLDNLVVL